MATEKELRTVIGRILKDIRIGIGDEFDQNFERQAFFTKAWARRRSPLRPGGHILVDTGALRKASAVEVMKAALLSIAIFLMLPSIMKEEK